MKKTLFRTTSLVMIILLLALSGCGSPTAAATQPPGAQSQGIAKIDACTLLTKADAVKIMGNPVDDPTHPVQGTQTFYVDSCKYKLTGGKTLDNVTLTLEIPANGDLATAQTTFSDSKQMAQATYNIAPLDISGLGDTAYWVGGEGNTLMIMKGMITFTLSASTQKGTSPSQAILDLAKVVLGRLP
jgi:hypothetical protein